MTEWTKQYRNDTGPDDDYLEEWFEVTDGEHIFRCEESKDADFLLFILRRQPELLEALKWCVKQMPEPSLTGLYADGYKNARAAIAKAEET